VLFALIIYKKSNNTIMLYKLSYYKPIKYYDIIIEYLILLYYFKII